eukprot:CAMPEP_0171459290 /NCGR_PEP_ID=MMETSP0945-20130129/4633_1 /TAXON_ID=109269 /ORGANISM="Vaucheria litorea, Strain CCMP2940" /LENGTH=377 /DNA_ID=CAMNT_0011985279 /DNA_START=19 /DNA_END=1152 /DNA_ORIENTATION=+
MSGKKAVENAIPAIAALGATSSIISSCHSLASSSSTNKTEVKTSSSPRSRSLWKSSGDELAYNPFEEQDSISKSLQDESPSNSRTFSSFISDSIHELKQMIGDKDDRNSSFTTNETQIENLSESVMKSSNNETAASNQLSNSWSMIKNSWPGDSLRRVAQQMSKSQMPPEVLNLGLAMAEDPNVQLACLKNIEMKIPRKMFKSLIDGLQADISTNSFLENKTEFQDLSDAESVGDDSDSKFSASQQSFQEEIHELMKNLQKEIAGLKEENKDLIDRLNKSEKEKKELKERINNSSKSESEMEDDDDPKKGEEFLNADDYPIKERFYQRRWFKIAIGIAGVVVVVALSSYYLLCFEAAEAGTAAAMAAAALGAKSSFK